MTATNGRRPWAALGLGLVLAAGALRPATAAPLPAGALLVVDGDGRPVGVLMPSRTVPVAAPIAAPWTMPDPVAGMMALQDATMRRMEARMAGLARMAAAGPVVGLPAGGDGAALVIRSVTTGADGCGRTVVWQQGPTDRAPRMVLDRVTDRCAAATNRRSPPVPAGVAPSWPAPAAPALQTIVDRHVAAGNGARRPF